MYIHLYEIIQNYEAATFLTEFICVVSHRTIDDCNYDSMNHRVACARKTGFKANMQRKKLCYVKEEKNFKINDMIMNKES